MRLPQATWALVVAVALGLAGGALGWADEDDGRGRGRGSGTRRGRQPISEQSDPGPLSEADWRRALLLLGRPTDRSVTVSVLARGPTEGYFEYGAKSDALAKKTRLVRLAGGTPAEVELTGLAPDTRYYYRFVHREPGATAFEKSETYTFHTQRKPGSAFTFTVQADAHGRDPSCDPELYARTLLNALADKPDFHVDLGDTFMSEKFARTEPDIERLHVEQRPIFGRLCHSAPLYLVLGNHEGEAGYALRGQSENLAVWATRARTRYFPNPIPDGFYTGNPDEEPFVGRPENYYAWHWGDALFVVLDGFRYTTTKSGRRADNWSCSLGRVQYDWLARVLAQSKAAFKFAFIHNLVGGTDRKRRGGVEHAAYYEWGGKNADGSDGFRQKRPHWPLPIHQLMVKHGVDVLFHGHDHFYARQEQDGIVYQLVPQPSHASRRTPASDPEYGYTSGTILPSAGHLRVRVSREAARIEYVRAWTARDAKRGRINRKVAHGYTLDAR